MAKVERTSLAEQDLSEIFDYVGENDAEQAVKLLRLINEKSELLAQFPEMGRARHEILINLRSFPIKSYIVFYQPIEDGIEILRVIHSSRDIEQVFDDFIDSLGREN